MTNLFAIVFAVVAICWTPVLGGKGVYQEVWDALGRSKDQGFFLPMHGINMNMTISLISLSNYDRKTSSLEVNYWMSMIWKDPTIQWNATEQGVDTIRVPAHMLWTPDIVPYTFKTHRESFKTYAVVLSDGGVIYVPAYTTRVTCKNLKAAASKSKDKKQSAGLRKQCQLKLGSWVFDALSLNISAYGVNLDNLDTTSLVGSGWAFSALKKKFESKYYSCCKEPYVSYTLKVIIKRNSRDDESEDGKMGAWVEEVEEVEDDGGSGDEGEDANDRV